VTTNKSTNNPSHCHSLACFNFHLLQNTNQIKLARGQSQSIQSFLIHLNQFNVTINQIKSKSNETNSFFLSLISLIIIESIKLFLSNSSIFNVSLLSINQSTNNQSNHTLSTHSQIKINSQINQLINQMNEWKQGCLFLWSALFVCLFRVICLFVCLFDSKLVVCWFYSSINQWNEINQTNQLSFLLHTLFSINQCQSSVNFFFHSFFPSLISIQSINQSIKRDQLTDKTEEEK